MKMSSFLKRLFLRDFRFPQIVNFSINIILGSEPVQNNSPLPLFSCMEDMEKKNPNEIWFISFAILVISDFAKIII